MRSPDFKIGTEDDPYLLRWFIIPRNPVFNIYLHQILRSDDDRALHDHPWWNLSIIIKGGYWEVLPLGVRKYRKKGNIIFRFAKAAHRLEVAHVATWTMFITGPRFREWGFYCPQGWRHWKVFSGRKDGVGFVTNGCD